MVHGASTAAGAVSSDRMRRQPSAAAFSPAAFASFDSGDAHAAATAVFEIGLPRIDVQLARQRRSSERDATGKQEEVT